MTASPPKSGQVDWASILERFDADAEDAVSDKELDAVVAGGVEAASLQERLAADEPSAVRLRMLREERARLAPVVDLVLQRAQAQLLQEQDAELQQQRAAAASRRPGLLGSLASSWQRLLMVGAPVAAAAVLLMPLLQQPASTPSDSGSGLADDLGVKGSSLTFVVLGTDGLQRQGRSGDTVEPGERLRFVRTTGRDNHFLMVLIDDDGQAQAVAPFGAASSVLLDKGVERPLEGSLLLDDQLGTERLVGLFANEPFTLVDVQRALDRQLPVAGGAAMAQALTQSRLEHMSWPGHHHVITLKKVAPKTKSSGSQGETR